MTACGLLLAEEAVVVIASAVDHNMSLNLQVRVAAVHPDLAR